MKSRAKLPFSFILFASGLLAGCSGQIAVSEDIFNCSPEQPNGICPTGEVCVNGHCEAIYQPCSPAYPNGVCPEGTCVNGICMTSSGQKACSKNNPGGYCDNPNEVCLNGKCVTPKPEEACSRDAPDGWCDPGYCCTGGACWPCGCVCGIDCPAGRCSSGEICDNGVCKPAETVTTKCGPGQCSGLCEYAQNCVEDIKGDCSCQAAAPASGCSPTNLAGDCPAGQWCLGGKCQEISDDMSCGKNCGSGICSGHAYCVADSEGCSCQENVSPDLVCSVSNPTGLCPDGLVCNAGSCSVPECSSLTPWGDCPAGQSCVKGRCQNGGDECSPSNPSGVCNDICDGDNCYEAVCNAGICVAATCSKEHLRGRCGGDCLICHEGSCITPPCSKEYACGTCPSCQVCNENADSPDYGTCGPAACSLACPEGTCSSEREICTSSGFCEVPACSVIYPWGDCRVGMYCEENKGPCADLATPEDCATDVSCTWNQKLNGCVRKNYGQCTLEECGSAPVSNLICNNPACEALDSQNACAAGPECTWGRCNGGGACPTILTEADCAANVNCWWQNGCFDGRMCVEGHCTTPLCSKLYPNGRCDEGSTCYEGTCVKLGCESDNDCQILSEKCEQLPIGTTGCIKQPCSVEKPEGDCLLLGNEYFGEICDGGNCVIPSCSATYPGGACGDAVCDAAQNEAACATAAPHCRWRPACVAIAGHNGPAAGVSCENNSDKSSCEAVSGCKWQGCTDGRICAGGNCLLPPCSESVPDGSCPAGMACEAGKCTLQNCGPVNPAGPCVCSDLNETDCKDTIKGLGCMWAGGACVNDPAATGFRICLGGVCKPFVCGADFGIAPCLDSSSICGFTGSSGDTCNVGDPGGGDGHGSPCCFKPSCCDTYPTGACGGGSERCVGGTCQKLPCSQNAPDGACGANQVCDNGVCKQAACSAENPGGHCECSILSKADCADSQKGFGCKWDSSSASCVDDPDSADIRKCAGGVCKPYLCGADFADAPCLVPGTVCDLVKHGETCETSQLVNNGDGINTNCCYTPVCSTDYPGGSCQPGYICNGGTCQQLPCSASNPAGACGAGKVCVNGECLSAPCSPEVPKGTCNCGSITRQADCTGSGAAYGCKWQGNKCIDDPASSASTSCLNGTCAPYLCRAEFPNAPCTSSGYVCKIPDAGEVCEGTNSGSSGACCVKPACSTDYPGGACPDGQTCSGGTCVPLPCSQVNQNGACASGKICKQGTCVTAPCSSTAPNGTCENAGQRCYNGECLDYVCSREFPGAACTQEGAVCGALVDPTKESCLSTARGDGSSAASPCCFVPTCSATYKSGTCQDSYICKNGECTQLPCSQVNKNGACASGQYCNNGTCEAIACSRENPTGPCADNTQRCVNGVCKDYLCGADFPSAPCSESGAVCGKIVNSAKERCLNNNGNGTSTNCCFEPWCSAQYPSGKCADGYICKGGNCEQLPCSPSAPNGVCGANQRCVEGQCEAAPCSNTALNGTCLCADLGQAACTNPESGFGCKWQGGKCIDDPDSSFYQKCVNGHCIPYLCGANFVNGPCENGGAVCGVPSGLDSCLNGANNPSAESPCCFIPHCSSTYKNGSCEEGSICKEGVCTKLPCSVAVPDGACPTGQECSSGVCIKSVCSQSVQDGRCECSDITVESICTNPESGFGCIWQGGKCIDDPASTNSRHCLNGNCTPYLCSAAFPNAPCAVSGTVCGKPANGESCADGGNPAVACCYVPNCSNTYPGGACPAGQYCSGGHCVAYPCSATNPTGACPASQVCENGSCQLAKCSNTAQDGTCYCSDITEQSICMSNVTGFGCKWQNGKCIDDPDSVDSMSCSGGSCQPYLCGANFPNAPCSESGAVCGKLVDSTKESCENNRGDGVNSNCCFKPWCSSTYPSGQCQSGYVCSNGTCMQLPCSAGNPTGACGAGQYCNAGVCTRYACSDEHPTGTCAAGKVCEKDNGAAHYSCSSPDCSASYPYGECHAAGTICVAGTCEATCGTGAGQSATGYCSGGLACVMTACANSCENDYDCDGIPNSVEGNDAIDTDGDGIPDSRDIDSDNDSIPDRVEIGPDPAHPLDSDGNGTPDYRQTDSDADGIPDSVEVGPIPTQPVDSDGDGIPDYRDVDSDGDLIYDKFEGQGDVDHDGIPNYLDDDSDGDGIPDSIEARPTPYDDSSFHAGDIPADHDGDGTYDFLDLDSDNDGVLDKDEDVNGNGIIDCQVNGRGEVVYVCEEITNKDVCQAHECTWNDAAKVCGETSCPNSCDVNAFNPGCKDDHARCVLSETSRIHVDSDCDGMGDGNDGLFLACAADNLKPINLFYDRDADIAMALEQAFDEAGKFSVGGVRGIYFDASNSSAAYGVSGFVLAKTPASAAINESTPRQKVIKQEEYDRGLLSSFNPQVVISRYSETFDGFATSIFRYTLTSSGSVSNARTNVLKALAGGANVGTPIGYGPNATAYTLIIQTIYRYDDGGSNGRVILLGAIIPTALYGSCGANNTSGTCNALASCNFVNNKCVEYDCRAINGAASCNSNNHCTWNDIDEICDNKQLPLFYVNNVTSGSTVTQFGDDLDKLCQSFSQKSGKVDFLWLLDFSNSIYPARQQIKDSASTFFELLNKTEADFRAAQTGAHTFDDNQSLYSGVNNYSGQYFTMFYGYNTSGVANSPWPPNYDFRACDSLNGVWVGANGCLIDEFTGSLAFSDDVANRDYLWNCASQIKGPGCTTNYTCTACGGATSGTVYAPECYFASRMVCKNTVGNSETPLLMAEWAMYRYFDKHICADAFEDGSLPTAETCDTREGCFWSGGKCIPNNCALATTAAQCETMIEDNTNDGVKLIGCLWNNQTNQCVPNYSCEAQPDDFACSNITIQNTCNLLGCTWNSWRGTCSGTLNRNTYKRCEDLTTEANCKLGAPLCYWNGSSCGWSVCDNNSKDRPIATYSRCSVATTQAACQQSTTCVWEDGVCRALPRERMRIDATPIIVAVTDEEECFLKDSAGQYGNGNGTYTKAACGGSQSTGDSKDFYSGNAADSYGYNWWNSSTKGYYVRQQRQESFSRFFQSRGTLVFTLTGEKATTQTNGGCQLDGDGDGKITASTSGNLTADINAQPGNALISVAENTGGGWGSICATNVYPAVESIIITSLAKSSAYKLEAAIDGKKVQPIGSTIKVVSEVCADDPAMTYMNYNDRCNQGDEYSCRANGCAWKNGSCSGCTNRISKVIPMSRENGFDYDALNNTITLFGSARPARGRDIVVSFRYWINNPQLPEGPSTNTCSCPGTSDCSQLSGEAACKATGTCTWTGLECTGEYASNCSAINSQSACTADSACKWENGTCKFACACAGGAQCGGLSCENQTTENGCNATIGCVWTVGMCMSTGICKIDPECGHSCNEYQTCNPNTGICECNLDCNNQCGLGEICNYNQECSGIGGEAACRAVESEGVCFWRIDSLICEDGDCGKCFCDKTCGGCGKGQLCDSDENSNTCGQCLCNTTCSDTNCNYNCASVNNAADCDDWPGCSWVNGSCKRTAYMECDPDLNSASCGFCVVDSDCSLHPCEEGEICNPTTGMCECDTTCGGGCKAGFICDSTPSSPTCGQCHCDENCGGETPPSGQKCDDNTNSATCGLFTCDLTCGSPCGAHTYCDEDEDSPTCGQCVCDTTCNHTTPNIGMKCDDNTNSATCGQIICGAACNGGCLAGQICNEALGTCGQCVCDTTCGGSCPTGQTCDSDTGSATCGQCVCDTTCGGSCPAHYNCNSDITSPTCGQCECDTNCTGQDIGIGKKCDDNPSSPTCGQVICDTTCNGGCASGQKCISEPANPKCGQCECDTTCGGVTPAAGSGLKCDKDTNSPTCGQLVCDTTCGGAAPGTGMKCDTSTTSPTCGQIVCDTECGNRCTGEKVCDSSATSATCGTCICGDECGGPCPVGQTCNPALGDCGQCVCDTTCGGGECPTGQKCDDNSNSPTCGACICDITCHGATPGAGQKCDTNTASATCGQIVCDTSCGNSCSGGKVCDDNINSATCGRCVCPDGDDSSCLASQKWQAASGSECGKCVCDTTCKNSCTVGQKCDDNTGSGTCGQCVCDTNCTGQPIGAGQKCDNNPSSNTCGQPICDTNCGGVNCGDGKVCDSNISSATCGKCICAEGSDDDCLPGQKWDKSQGECGACVCDITCGGGCLSGQKCDSTIGSPTCGQCICDTTCGGPCPDNWDCDNDKNSPTCGQCQCDTTCGGGQCTGGKVCDDNSASQTCGQCICDQTCGGACPAGQSCDQNLASQTCGQCICDTTCGGACPTGQKCDGTLGSATCGQCQCDTTCGFANAASIPAGKSCDNNPASATCGQLICDTTCGGKTPGLGEKCDNNPLSPTCGELICDTTCGGAYGLGLVCDSDPDSPTCGQLVCDQTCGGSCPVGQMCDSNYNSLTCGQCLCDTTCGDVTPAPGMTCDSNELSPTCGQIVCDVTCGGPCDTGSSCDTNTASPTCGQCVCDQTCGGLCEADSSKYCDKELNSATCGQCLCDATCGGSCPTGQCCDGNDECGAIQDEMSCLAKDGCIYRAGIGCESLTCGQCQVDPTCCNCQELPNGATSCCAEGTVCNPNTGLCEVNADCCAGREPAEQYRCNIFTGECIFIAG